MGPWPNAWSAKKNGNIQAAKTPTIHPNRRRGVPDLIELQSFIVISLCGERELQRFLGEHRGPETALLGQLFHFDNALDAFDDARRVLGGRNCFD
jgi:hypothetical protein